ncbi:alternative oxidase [Alteromonas oceanisediminis]|uniref:alternative oxidase n=1 Tax=Alteromonas oceanisediminis TaxID=2836180 RepID=UPI001BDB623C|nr:alternative oxidase [Alteromonas oceanisediminis]MBT0587267.1 oxidase [Alteromonas oceanisediminis]
MSVESKSDEERREETLIHHKPRTFSDKVALYFVKFLRVFADAFFAKRYGHRAVVLETVAAVPGMVGGAMLHLKSLRKLRDDEGWIHTLLDEAENERMHLMTFIEIAKPTRFERFLVIVTQMIFYVSYLLLYLISAKTAHRVVGYLEEEAVVSYSQYADRVKSGDVENVDAPQVALDYWDLPHDAKLLDVIRVIRADEMTHREVNHLIADKISEHPLGVKTHADMSDDAQAKLRDYEQRDFPI